MRRPLRKQLERIASMANSIAMSGLRSFLHGFVGYVNEEELHVSRVGELCSESGPKRTWAAAASLAGVIQYRRYVTYLRSPLGYRARARHPPASA